MTYRQQVYAVMTNRYNRYDCVKVCDTPSLFVQLGMTQLPILYTPRHLRDAVRPYVPHCNRHLHCLRLDTIKRLPELIADPVMIFKSPTHTGSLIVVTDELDREGRPIIATVKPNVPDTVYGGRQTESNLITSVFGRNCFRSFVQRVIDQDCMIYCNNEKSKQLFSLLSVTMPQGLNNNVCFDTIIQQTRPKVNNKGDIIMSDETQIVLNLDKGELENLKELYGAVPNDKDTVCQAIHEAIEEAVSNKIHELNKEYGEVIDAVEQRYGLMAAKRLLTEETAKAIVADYHMKKANNDTARYLLSDAIDEHITPEQVQAAKHNKTIYFDTETTGLNKDGDDEILSIAIINENEEILLHTYVKPEHHTSWEDAERINHISPEMVKDSPTFTQLKPLLKEIFNSADEIVAYNINYDRQFIEMPLDIHFGSRAKCAMLAFAEYYQEPNERTGQYRWKNLSFAMEHFGKEWRGQAHGALADTYAAKDVWNKLHSPTLDRNNTFILSR